MILFGWTICLDIWDAASFNGWSPKKCRSPAFGWFEWETNANSPPKWPPSFTIDMRCCLLSTVEILESVVNTWLFGVVRLVSRETEVASKIRTRAPASGCAFFELVIGLFSEEPRGQPPILGTTMIYPATQHLHTLAELSEQCQASHAKWFPSRKLRLS